MPRTKIMLNPKRFNAVVNQDTYTTLVTLAGRQTMIEGRPVSLAEYVRNILEDAVSRTQHSPVPVIAADYPGTDNTIPKLREAASRRPAENGDSNE